MAVEIPISRTKIVVPALRPEILHRRRLLALFDDLLDKKLVIVAAPAGYGKTSLLVDFARQSEMPVCWLSLDALDRDPQRFCAYLIAALEQRFPRFGKQSKAALGSLTSFEQDSERLLSALVNEIDGQIDSHFALAVDDYQFVDSVPDIHNLFSRLILLAGENCHIILASRRLPILPDITLMVARQQVGGFDLEELAFRPNEVRALFEMNYDITLGDSVVEELMLQTEGWITGLHLSASRVAHSVPDLTRAARTTGVDLDSYLDSQVLSPQPARLRKFLLQTSLLEEFDAELCEAVLGRGEWRNLIKTVRMNNLFVLLVGPGGKWLRYHHIFQEFLQNRMRREDPEKTQTILKRLAEVYQGRHEWEKAYALIRQSGDYSRLAGLLELAGTPMLLSEHLITLRNWLDELPAGLIEGNPSLLSIRGALLCALGEGRSAVMLLDRAIPELQVRDDLPNLALAYVRRAAAYRLVGNYANSLQDAEEALRLSDDRPELRAIFAEAERFKGLSLYLLGQITQAVQALEDALRRYEELGEKQSMARVQTELGMAYRANGDYPAAHAVYERALAEWRREGNLLSQANLLNNLGVLHHYQGEYEAAIRAFETGLEYARQSGFRWQESAFMTSLGDVYCDLDEHESANQAYINALEIAKQVGFQILINYLSLAQARLARLRGLNREAHRHLAEAETFVQATGSNYDRSFFHLELGCLRVMENKPAQAIPDLERALEHAQQGNLIAEAARSRVWLAVAYLGSGDGAAARLHLRTILGVGKAEPVYFPVLQTVRQVRPWLAGLREDPETGPELAAWLESAAQVEARLPALRKRLRRLLSSLPIQTPHLSIQAFGRAQVRLNGKLVSSAQWRTASVRELFFYFLSNPRPVSKEAVGGALWPELDNSHLKLRFKNNLYHLRHALGMEIIQFENNTYFFNRFQDYEYDIENFEANLDKVKSAIEVEKRIAALRAAIDLRKGPFLQDLDATWVLPERERLDRACLDALKQLVELQRETGNLQAALAACQEALKIDLCREDIHFLAMQIHAQRGDRLAVIWQYQACREALRAELDVDPPDEMVTLYRQQVLE
jgi:LuxR family transcriptional regulator, maltose regulon positive regulatory protein